MSRCEVCRVDLNRRDWTHDRRPKSRFCTVCNDRLVNEPGRDGGRVGDFRDRLAAAQDLHERLRGNGAGWGPYEFLDLTSMMYAVYEGPVTDLDVVPIGRRI